MRRHDLRHLEPYRTPPPPSWGELDAEYYPPQDGAQCPAPGARRNRNRRCRAGSWEPGAGHLPSAWIWGLAGYALGLISFALLLALGGQR